ncbi:MAG: hypothetical protein JWM75_1835, partial [Sphingomonas bacterium]|nr:hypothetical protein [Sphingomonas bacterium]
MNDPLTRGGHRYSGTSPQPGTARDPVCG